MSNRAYSQGEFRGDFTRDTFDPLKHFSRVFMQQGRVQLDADWNEQTSIIWHYLRALAADLIGPHGGRGDGFMIESLPAVDVPTNKTKQDFSIHEGRYYVQGLLCENDQRIAYFQHRGLSFEQFEQLHPGNYLVYLDAWERHITFIEDEDLGRNNPAIREVALGGPDTATRAMVVWQVKTKPVDGAVNAAVNKAKDYKQFLAMLGVDIPSNAGRLKAKAQGSDPGDDEPCIIKPEARYRGLENQLYRVEIHNPGTTNEATFKWSRDNGSVAFPLRELDSDGTTTTVTLVHLGRDQRSRLALGDWVEIVDDDYALQNHAESLLQVSAIDRDADKITLRGAPADMVGQNPHKHPFLRRWDQHKNKHNTPDEMGIPIVESTTEWIELESGVQIQFQPSNNGDYQYRTGDYWLIPARVATGDVEWPGSANAPVALLPHGVQHHYAPLAVITVNNDGIVEPKDVRRTFSLPT